MTTRVKNLVVLAILAAASAALGLYAYFGVVKGEQAESEKKEVSELLLPTREAGQRRPDGGRPPDPVFTALVISAKGENTSLERNSDGGWQIVAPVRALADRNAVDQVTTQLLTGRVTGVVEEKPTEADLERHGLQAPRFELSATAELESASGSTKTTQIFKLVGGAENPYDGSISIRRGDDPKVYSAQGGLRYAVEKNTFDLRDKEVFALEEARLQKIEVAAKANRYTLERNAEKSWAVVKPVEFLADNQTVASMLSALRTERATGFPEDTASARQTANLSAPDTDATFTFQDGEQVRVRIGVLKVDAGAEEALALRDDSLGSTLARVAASAAHALDRSPADLRDKSIASFKPESVWRMVLSRPGEADVVVARVGQDGGGDEWELVSPKKSPAKKWKLSSLFWNLSTLKASSIAEEHPKDWAKYGLAPPTQSFALYGAGDALLGRIDVGKAVPGKTPEEVFMRGARPEVLQLESSRLGDLPNSADDLEDKPETPGDGGTPAPP